MAQNHLTQEVVTLIRRLGTHNKVQLQPHLPAHDLEAIERALEDACSQGLLKAAGSGSFVHVSELELDESSASSIVAHALRYRTVLELGWCGALS